jgi:hypothetical protein
VGGPQSRSGRGGEEKNSQPLPVLEPPDHPARSLVAIPLSEVCKIVEESILKICVPRRFSFCTVLNSFVRFS